MNIGIAGIGFMGMIHYTTYQKIRDAKIVAICEQVPKRLKGDWRDIKGNFGPAGTMVNLAGIATYSHVDDLLNDPNVELVDICLPPALHADVAVKAMQAGKDVFCEKPMALAERDTHRMAAVAKSSKRLLMIGHVLPRFPEYAFLCKAAERGEFGRVLGGRFLRVISDPAWLTRYYDPTWIGGPMLDLHIHDAHLIRMLFGMPRSVQGVGRMREDVASYFETQFIFDNPDYVVTATSGVIAQPSRPFMHGFEVHFDRATICYQSGVFDGKAKTIMPLTVIPQRGRIRTPKMPNADPMAAFLDELTHVVQAVKTRRPANFLDHLLAQDAVRICHAETKAVQTGKRIRVG